MQRFSKGFIYFYNLGSCERVKIFLYNRCRLSETMRQCVCVCVVCLLLRLQFDHSSINAWNLLQIREVLVTLVEGKHGIQYRPNQVSPLRRSEANKPNRARPRNFRLSSYSSGYSWEICLHSPHHAFSFYVHNMLFNDRNKQQLVHILKLIIFIRDVFTNLFIDFSSDRHDLHRPTRIIDS